MREAFTLIELLVVVTIIVILVAILVPSLESAAAHAQRARCLANEKGMGLATSVYLNDHRRVYPVIEYWNGLLGRLGATGYDGHNPDVDQRPLNAYLGFSGEGSEVPIASCPSDLGDPLVTGSQNAYREWGTSYLAPVYRSHWGIEAVYGITGPPTVLPPMRAQDLMPAHNKIIAVDWVVLGDRLYQYRQTRWHNPDPQQREFNVLYADMHAETYRFPIHEIEGPQHVWRDVNPSIGWW